MVREQNYVWDLSLQTCEQSQNKEINHDYAWMGIKRFLYSLCKVATQKIDAFDQLVIRQKNNVLLLGFEILLHTERKKIIFFYKITCSELAFFIFNLRICFQKSFNLETFTLFCSLHHVSERRILLIKNTLSTIISDSIIFL